MTGVQTCALPISGINLDGCRNCKFMIRTGLVQVTRCGKDNMMVDELDKCSNFKLKLAKREEDSE